MHICALVSPSGFLLSNLLVNVRFASKTPAKQGLLYHICQHLSMLSLFDECVRFVILEMFYPASWSDFFIETHCASQSAYELSSQPTGFLANFDLSLYGTRSLYLSAASLRSADSNLN